MMGFDDSEGELMSEGDCSDEGILDAPSNADAASRDAALHAEHLVEDMAWAADESSTFLSGLSESGTLTGPAVPVLPCVRYPRDDAGVDCVGMPTPRNPASPAPTQMDSPSRESAVETTTVPDSPSSSSSGIPSPLPNDAGRVRIRSKSAANQYYAVEPQRKAAKFPAKCMRDPAYQRFRAITPDMRRIVKKRFSMAKQRFIGKLSTDKNTS